MRGILVLLFLASAHAGPDPRVERLKAALDGTDPKVREKAVSALANEAYTERSRQDGVLGDWAQAAVPLLIRALADPDDKVAGQAGSALGQIGPMAREAVPALLERVQNGKRRARDGAIRGLGGIGKDAATAVPVLLPFLKEKDGDFQIAAAAAMGGIGPDARTAVPDLIQAFRRCLEQGAGASYAAATCARALGGIGPDAAQAVDVLSPHALDRDPDLRRGALSGLAGIGGAGMPRVLEALSYRGPDLGNGSAAQDLRWDAAIALAGSGTRDPRALSAVVATLTDDTEASVVKQEAVGVLVHAGKAAIPELKKVRKHFEDRLKTHGRTGAESRVAGAVLRTLGELGEKE